MIDDDFQGTICRAFNIASDDTTIYGAQPAVHTLSEIQQLIKSGIYKYHYRNGCQKIAVRGLLIVPPASASSSSSSLIVWNTS